MSSVQQIIKKLQAHDRARCGTWCSVVGIGLGMCRLLKNLITVMKVAVVEPSGMELKLLYLLPRLAVSIAWVMGIVDNCCIPEAMPHIDAFNGGWAVLMME